MKTTFDLPDDLMHQAKIVAAQRKTTLKELVLRGLVSEMQKTNQSADETEAFVTAFSRGANVDHPIGKTPRHEIHDRPILHRL